MGFHEFLLKQYQTGIVKTIGGGDGCDGGVILSKSRRTERCQGENMCKEILPLTNFSYQ